ncbi:SCO6745 family protein [Streptomyces sparsogenes]|uniref:SCO6745 family protein n=1 Tax=Streptomyces sparsogenes TaxID=67365 RepID=UPI003F4D38D7
MVSDSIPQIAARCHQETDPIHLLCYFAPEVEQELTSTGLEPGHMAYFAGRAAALGRASSAAVAAMLYNFNPALVARHLPRAWDLAPPERVIEARLSAVDRALRRILGDEAVGGPEVAEAAALARAAAEACSPEGRPLYAAHAQLPWPREPHLVLWHAITLLREHRGDGHITALVGHGVGAIAALVTDTATGRSLFGAQQMREHRDWSEQEWDAEVSALTEAGLLDSSGRLTETGSRLRSRIEDATDAAAAPPYRSLGADRAERLIALCKPLRDAVVASGDLPRADAGAHAAHG